MKPGESAFSGVPVTKLALAEEQPDFSLVLGGPLFQLYRRARLSGNALELLHRRVLFIAAIAWAPLLLLSAFSGHALGDAVAVPFFHDIEAHFRFLIALPILIAAERVVHLRLPPVLRGFVERRMVTPESMPKFNQAIESTLRLRNSVVIEVALLVLVYTVGLWVWASVWRSQIALDTSSWYAISKGAEMHLTPAGYWYLFVSLPIFQFILLRWYLRLVLWFWLLYRISRLNLRLIPIHPDKTGGLGFLERSTHAFAPILVAQGAAMAGLIGSQIFHAGKNLMDFKFQIVGFMGFCIVTLLIPLAMFMPLLARAKQQGLGDLGKLSTRYAGEFEGKWVHGGAQADEMLLGSADIQSLADLATSYGIVNDMRLVPFGLKDVVRLALLVAVPFLPLLLTIFSPAELAGYIVKFLF